MRRNIGSLKLMNLIPPEVNVPQMLASHLHPKPTDFDVSGFTDNDILSQVHGAIMKRYLQWRLEATSDEIETFFRIYSYNMRHKSLRWFCENIEIAIDLGFTPRKLLSFGYLVNNDPKVPKEVLEKIPTFAGADMRVMMRRYPKLVTIPLKQYFTIYDILKSTIMKSISITACETVVT
ncbi:hypothetical protein AMK59_3102 [Oryctes borbonicus]|uniref:Uncharacterized protein n=1 Tax=Oryctes borbonicus TaxID=1629725 RepID=A0A0T6B552_9SCAR|nr:hypothetical protein AMK59_3102 [Oryctes borbonicus]